MPDELTPLERQVIATLLAPEHPVTRALHRQFEACRVVSREFTGRGFFSKLVVADGVDAAPVTRKRLHLGDATPTIAGLEHGAGLVLLVREGVLDMLEGFAYDEPWPNAIGRFEISAGGISHVGGSENRSGADRGRVGPEGVTRSLRAAALQGGTD
ncbi:MAG TPA: hypothetical protein VNM34_16005 [Verrucomicrobiae bacterium]|nr:hypothetical protein [Verrucomicrobiae bacterium]